MPEVNKVTVQALRLRKGTADKVAVLTAYDVAFARLADAAGIDAVLVGDSLGMVTQGHPNTLPVTVDDMIYHARAVARGLCHAHLMVDMPFGSYQAGPEDGLRAAFRLVKEGGAESVKLEGGEEVAPLVARLVAAGVPVVGHVGMTPQSVHAFGGFKVQGRAPADAARIGADARAVADAGAFALVIESVPEVLGTSITQGVPCLTIGIGAGRGCDGQVLVMHDVLGLDPDFKPRFARRYADLGAVTREAFARFAADVKSGQFPTEGESFH